MSSCTKQPCHQTATRRGMCNTHYEQHRTRQQAYGRWESTYIDAEPARQHVQTLRATGMGTRRIAELAETPRQTIANLVNGRPDRGTVPSRKIDRDSSTRILAIPVPDAHELAKDRQLVGATGTARRLQALVAIGYTQVFLCESIGVTASNGCRLFDIRRQSHVQAATARRVETVFNALQLTPGPSDRARRHAQRKGWPPPLAWDEDTIDDPAVNPDLGAHGRGSFEERYQELRDLGLPDEAIATRLGIKPVSLVRQLDRYGLPVSPGLHLAVRSAVA